MWRKIMALPYGYSNDKCGSYREKYLVDFQLDEREFEKHYLCQPISYSQTNTRPVNISSSGIILDPAEKSISSELSHKAKKLVEEELKDIRKEASRLRMEVGNLRTEIEQLKIIQKMMSEESKKIREDIEEEARHVEDILKKYFEKIFRFQILDI